MVRSIDQAMSAFIAQELLMKILSIRNLRTANWKQKLTYVEKMKNNDRTYLNVINVKAASRLRLRAGTTDRHRSPYILTRISSQVSQWQKT